MKMKIYSSLDLSETICESVKFLYQVLITDKVSEIYLLSKSKCYINKEI